MTHQNPEVIEAYKRLAGAIIIEAVRDNLKIGTSRKPREVVRHADVWFRTDEFEFYLCAMPMLTPEAVLKFMRRYKTMSESRKIVVKTRLAKQSSCMAEMGDYTSKNHTVHSGILRVAVQE